MPDSDTRINNAYEFGYIVLVRFGFQTLVSGVLLYAAFVVGDRMSAGYLDTLKVVQDSVIRQSSAMEKFAEAMSENEKNGQLRTDLLKTILEEQQKTTRAIEGMRNGK